MNHLYWIVFLPTLSSQNTHADSFNLTGYNLKHCCPVFSFNYNNIYFKGFALNK